MSGASLHESVPRFLQSYLETVAGAPFIPTEREDLEIMLDAFMLEKAISELGFELDNRPDWVRIPVMGIKTIIGRDNA